MPNKKQGPDKDGAATHFFQRVYDVTCMIP